LFKCLANLIKVASLHPLACKDLWTFHHNDSSPLDISPPVMVVSPLGQFTIWRLAKKAT